MADHHEQAAAALEQLREALDKMAVFDIGGRHTGLDTYRQALHAMTMFVLEHDAADQRAAFVCPRCGKRSYSPEDAHQGYCGLCHWWTGDATLGAPEVLEIAERDGALTPMEALL